MVFGELRHLDGRFEGFAGAAHGCNSGSHIQRQHLFGRHAGQVEHVDQVHVRVDQPGQGEFAAAVDAHRVAGHVDRIAGTSNGRDFFAANDNRTIGEHRRGVGIEDRAAGDH